MYINITDSETSSNKGSSADLVHYLDKENRLFRERQPEHWFNGSSRQIAAYQVKGIIDGNVAKLGKRDAKFYLVNISPSQKEIRYLKEQFGEQGAKEKLKDYAVKMMDEYAKNFSRPGISSHKDLVWFAKLENHRYYSHRDREVKAGIKKRGELKEGEQMHIQVIVSRKDVTNLVKLSPMNNSKGKNPEHSRKMGQFDRAAFKKSGERVFDQLFGFQRGIAETFEYANLQAKGILQARLDAQLDLMVRGRDLLAAEGYGHAKLPGQTDKSLLDQLLARPDFDPVSGAFKKKKKRRRKRDQGLSF